MTMRPRRVRTKRHGWLIGASLAVLAATAAACGSSDDHAARKYKRPAAADPARSVASVTVSAMDGTAQGSAVLIDKAGTKVLVMSDHLLEGAAGRSIKVRFANGETAQGRTVARNMCSDIALVAVRPVPHDVPALAFGDLAQLGPGAKVRALGYHATPHGKGTPVALATSGEVSAVGVSERLFRTLRVVPGLILHQSPMPEGATGGALVDARGRLVGVNVDIHPGGAGAGRPHLAKAVSAAYLKQTLAQLDPSPSGLFRGWESYHVCHGKMIAISRLTRGGKAGGGGAMPDDGSKHHGDAMDEHGGSMSGQG